MGCSAKQYYSYALNENNELIHIDAAHREAQYRCPNCGELMIPRMGKIRRWHFAHKANIMNCSYETYLHKIAKIRIREAFLVAREFFICFEAPAICNNKDCEIRSGNLCEFKIKTEYDLKEYYDSCEEERPYKNFVADLLLTSSTKPKRAPILIEIYVSHKSTDEKINDGVRIIEIQIQSEEDIEAIVSSCKIEENKGPFVQAEKPSVTFYHFQPTKKQESPPDYYNVIYYLWMYEWGYFKGGQYSCTEKCPIPATAHYIVSPFGFNWTWAFLEFKKQGVDVKNCLICKYKSETSYGERICMLYKKHGTPRQPKTTTAKQCQYFRPISKAPMMCFIENIEDWLDFIKKQELNPEYKFVIRKK